MNKKNITDKIKKKAVEIGFDACGIAQVKPASSEIPHLQNWTAKQYHGSMNYMTRNFEKRIDPTKLVDHCTSIICLISNYFPGEDVFKNSNYKISKYAYGKDYHFIIKNRLKKLLDFILELAGNKNARMFVDSAPVLERFWAQQAGLGWIGKNCNLITKDFGSFVFLSEIIIEQELEYDEPHAAYCGSCAKCLDACPTNALIKPNTLDSRKCISYQTIENKAEIPENLSPLFNNWIFGCDICQDICPWNKKAKPHQISEFQVSEKLQNMTDKNWKNLSKDEFSNLFKGSAVKRTKYKGLKRNIDFLSE